MTVPLVVSAWLMGCLLASGGDLAAIRSEPNLERRSERALANANQAITQARDQYSSNDMAKTKDALIEAAESVEMSWEALNGTGKNPRRSPKYFKKAEVSIREMIRRLKNLESDFGVEDRPMLVSVEERFQAVHDRLIDGIMSNKKK